MGQARNPPTQTTTLRSPLSRFPWPCYHTACVSSPQETVMSGSLPRPGAFFLPLLTAEAWIKRIGANLPFGIQLAPLSLPQRVFKAPLGDFWRGHFRHHCIGPIQLSETNSLQLEFSKPLHETSFKNCLSGFGVKKKNDNGTLKQARDRHEVDRWGRSSSTNGGYLRTIPKTSKSTTTGNTARLA